MIDDLIGQFFPGYVLEYDRIYKDSNHLLCCPSKGPLAMHTIRLQNNSDVLWASQGGVIVCVLEEDGCFCCVEEEEPRWKNDIPKNADYFAARGAFNSDREYELIHPVIATDLYLRGEWKRRKTIVNRDELYTCPIERIAPLKGGG